MATLVPIIAINSSTDPFIVGDPADVACSRLMATICPDLGGELLEQKNKGHSRHVSSKIMAANAKLEKTVAGYLAALL